MKRIPIFAVVIGLALCAAGPARALTDRDLTYRPTQIWNSAVRFIRVDQHFKILEKDKDASYMLFEYKDGGRSYQASFEMVPVVKDNKRLVRVRLNIEQMPSYVEAVLADSFLRKLRDEHGSPPPPRELARIPEKQAKAEGADEAEKAKEKGKSKAGDGEEEDDDVDEDDLQIVEDELEEEAEED